MEAKLNLKKDLKEKRELINITLDRYLPRKDEYPKEIHKAIRHSLFAGGKRLRPYLCIRAYNLFATDLDVIKPVAGALEMLHTYTLIHDDLPAIDNDDYRRGKKTCHKVFGDSIALLAGDALLANAFELIANTDLDDNVRIKMIRELAEETGVNGLIAGQMADIVAEGKKIGKQQLEFIHKNKTGRLITMSVRFGMYAGNAPEEDIKMMEKYGDKLGLAFQIIDDILDIEGDEAILGKTIGKDEKAAKATYPALYGLEKARDMAKKLTEEANDILDRFGEKAGMLKLLTEYLYTRAF